MTHFGLGVEAELPAKVPFAPGMDDRDACLHPYRKRKFFYALAELLNEPRPAVRRLDEFFPAARGPPALETAPDGDTCGDEPATHQAVPLGATHSQHGSETSVRPSQEPEDDSFEYVEFGRPRASLESASSSSLRHSALHSQSSLHDSMQDSLLFLPPGMNHDASVANGRGRLSQDLVGATQPTVLSWGPADRHAELVDYYDLDRYCEPVPCWAHDSQSSCALHREPIRRPMLLFCLQALDEFIASARDDGALVASCRLARIVFADMWEQDVRRVSIDADIALADYLCETSSVPGVALDVWRVIDACWRAHKQHFLHHQELYFVEASAAEPSRRVAQWHRIRDLLQVFALRPEAARRLEAELPPGKISFEAIQTKSFTRNAAHLRSIQFGLAYLQHIRHKRVGDEASPCRDLVGQSDWKIAFSAIEIHLKKWSRDIQVFPCGSFPRGAAFGSVVDLLVGLPEHESSEGDAPIQGVLGVLSKAKVVEIEQAYVLSNHRALAMIPFKNASLILDVKAYRRPQSWFALLYYTGPERFTQSYFSRLLDRPLAELSVVNFDHIYECVVELLGLDVVASVDSEKHLFDLINADYIKPNQRM